MENKGFEESIIIPMEEYNKCIAPLKLYDQSKRKIVKLEERMYKKDDDDIILNNFKNEDKDRMAFILKNYIYNNNQIISWNHNFELIIYGDLIKKSNLIDCMKYLFIEGNNFSDQPTGVETFKNVLLKIGLPEKLIIRKIKVDTKRNNQYLSDITKTDKTEIKTIPPSYHWMTSIPPKKSTAKSSISPIANRTRKKTLRVKDIKHKDDRIQWKV